MAENEKDKYGETMKLVERAKEDIYFAQRDRELLEKLRSELKKVDTPGDAIHCPKCDGVWENYSFQGFTLDRCRGCEGIWMDKGELEGVIKKLSRGPLGEWIERLVAKH